MPFLTNGVSYLNQLLDTVQPQLLNTREQNRALRLLRNNIYNMYDDDIKNVYIMDKEVDIQRCANRIARLINSVAFDPVLQRRIDRWWSILSANFWY